MYPHLQVTAQQEEQSRHLLRIQIQMRPVDLIKSPQQILRGAIDVIATTVVGEITSQWTSFELPFEQIDLIQEQDYGCAHEPAAVDYAVEKYQGFHHAILIRFFKKHLVVLGQRNAEDNRGNIFEAVDPLFTFGTLAANIKHALPTRCVSQSRLSLKRGQGSRVLYTQLSHCETRFVYTCRFRSSSKDIGLDRDVIRLGNPDYFVKETICV